MMKHTWLLFLFLVLLVLGLSGYQIVACVGRTTTRLHSDPGSAAGSDTPSSEKARLLRELAEPLLDEKLIKEVLYSWTRPLPSGYLTSPLVLSGPSGVGKARLYGALMQDYAKFFKKVVTHTTRSPRSDEVNGTHYHFVSKSDFQMLNESGFFLEHSVVHGNYYGLSFESFQNVTKEGKISVFEIDVQGARNMREIAKAQGLTPKFLFISPSSILVLRERLQGRGADAGADMELRLANAVEEIRAANQETALYERVLVNHDFELCSRALFRTCRDWYPQLPSPARLRMLQRRISKIKQLGTSG